MRVLEGVHRLPVFLLSDIFSCTSSPTNPLNTIATLCYSWHTHLWRVSLWPRFVLWPLILVSRLCWAMIFTTLANWFHLFISLALTHTHTILCAILCRTIDNSLHTKFWKLCMALRVSGLLNCWWPSTMATWRNTKPMSQVTVLFFLISCSQEIVTNIQTMHSCISLHFFLSDRNHVSPLTLKHVCVSAGKCRVILLCIT